MQAFIEKIVPSNISINPTTGQQSENGNYIIVKEITSGITHTLINGSLNQINPKFRKLGQQGSIKWIKQPSYSLPFFIPNNGKSQSPLL